MIRLIDFKDYDNGVMTLLGQLTESGTPTRDQFCSQLDLMNRNNVYTFVYVKEDKIVGIASIFIEPKLIHNLSFVGHIEDVVVDQQFRGCHIGKELITHLTRFAEGKGCYKVILDCDEKNMSFYEKCGYKRNGVEMRINLNK